MSCKPIIRPLNYNDLDSIMTLEHKCFSIPWTRGMFEDELFNQNAVYLIVEVSGIVCGYAGMWKIIDEGHITNVAVHPNYRRRGYGRALIQSLISYCKDNDIVAITLEVRESNRSAILLYESFNFVSAGRRKHYYANNDEDALIMWLYLN